MSNLNTNNNNHPTGSIIVEEEIEE
jgi:hypothetical protein